MRLVCFLLLFSALFANPQSATPVDGAEKDKDAELVNFQNATPVDEVDEVDEVKKEEDSEQRYLFEDYFFFEEEGGLEKNLVLGKNPVYRINSPSFFSSGPSSIEDFSTYSFLSLPIERDHSRILAKDFSQMIYPWNFFINQFFYLHDIRFSVYVENTYLYSDMASTFYRNWQNTYIEPKSVWYFKFRYVW